MSTNSREKLDYWEEHLLGKFIFLLDWQFDLLKKHFIRLDNDYIDIDKKSNKREYVTIFGLLGLETNTGEKIICNFFVRFDGKLYQSFTLENAVKLQKAIMKQCIIDDARKNIKFTKNKK